MDIGQFALIAEATRGGDAPNDHVEGVHLGAVVVVTGRGEVVASVGDPTVGVHLRSTAKPFQLLPLLLDGIHREPLGRKESFGRKADKTHTIDAADLAVMMASHNGEPRHVGRVRRLLSFGGLEAEQLQCGAHPPIHEPSNETLIAAHQDPDVLHCNCSGKHTGMLLTCLHNGWSTETYLSPTHPLQQRIAHLISELSGVPEAELGRGTDGCSAPTLVLPLIGIARLFARLACPDSAPEPEAGVREALSELFDAGTSHPDMIAGRDRLDTAVMRALPGVVFAKVGAMGVHAMAVAPCELYPDGLGIAIKIADGDLACRVRPIVSTALLIELGLLDQDFESPRLRKIADPTLTNNRELPIGQLRAVLALERPS